MDGPAPLACGDHRFLFGATMNIHHRQAAELLGGDMRWSDTLQARLVVRRPQRDGSLSTLIVGAIATDSVVFELEGSRHVPGALVLIISRTTRGSLLDLEAPPSHSWSDLSRAVSLLRGFGPGLMSDHVMVVALRGMSRNVVGYQRQTTGDLPRWARRRYQVNIDEGSVARPWPTPVPGFRGMPITTSLSTTRSTTGPGARPGSRR